MAILFNKNLKVVSGSKYLDSSGRISLTEIQIEGKNDVFSTLSNFSKHDIILAGDWNVVLNNGLDKDAC